MNANNAKKTGDLATAQAESEDVAHLVDRRHRGGVIIGTIYGIVAAMNNGSF